MLKVYLLEVTFEFRANICFKDTRFHSFLAIVLPSKTFTNEQKLMATLNYLSVTELQSPLQNKCAFAFWPIKRQDRTVCYGDYAMFRWPKLRTKVLSFKFQLYLCHTETRNLQVCVRVVNYSVLRLLWSYLNCTCLQSWAGLGVATIYLV